jgi:FixJ family two-component response regulator
MESSSASEVYIIESDASVAIALARLFRAAKFAATCFKSVEDFLRSDIQGERACVISEVELPGISGLALPKLLVEAGKKLPVIIVTAATASDLKDRSLHPGAVAHLSKPADDEDLLRAVADALISHERSET